MNFLGFRKKNTNPESSSGKEVLHSVLDNNIIKGKTKIILQRLHSCKLAREFRETLNDLRISSDLAECVQSSDIRFLFGIVHEFEDDEDLMISVLRLLVVILNNLKDNSKLRLSEGERNGKLSHFFKEVAEEAPLLLDCLKTGNNDMQELSMNLLYEIADNDYSSIRKTFFAPQVCELLVELATRTPSGTQSQCLQMLLLLTTTNPELQTLFSEKSYDSLFSFVKQSGGADGSSEVSDALSIVRNIIRQNEEGQNVFFSSGSARSVGSFFDSIVAQLQKTWKNGGDKSIPESSGWTESTFINLLSCLQLLNAILECGSSEQLLQKRIKFLEAGIFQSVASIALSGSVMDDAVRIAALRTLGDLLRGCADTVKAFLGLDVISVVASAPRRLVIWSATRGLLENLLSDACDSSLLDATLHVFTALLSVESCLEGVTISVLKGLPTTKSYKGDLKDSGRLLVEVLLGERASHIAKYYAAHLLRMISIFPACAKKVTSLSLGKEGVPSSLRTSEFPKREKEAMFSEAFITYTISKLQGGPRGGLDTTTLSAYAGVLFLWIEAESTATKYLCEPQRFTAILRLGSSDSSAHVQFWCGALAASLCVHSTEDQTSILVEQFKNQLGGSIFFGNILRDVKASNSHYESPAASALALGKTVLYDEKFVHLLNKSVEDFEALMKKLNPLETQRNHLGVVLPSNPQLSPSAQHPKEEENAALRDSICELNKRLIEQQSELHIKNDEIERLNCSNAQLRAENSELHSLISSSRHMEGKEHSTRQRSEDASTIAELQDIVQVLEQELKSAEQQQLQLVETMNTMEKQLKTRMACSPEEEVLHLKQQLDQANTERDEALILVGELYKKLTNAGNRSDSASIADEPSSLELLAYGRGDQHAIPRVPQFEDHYSLQELSQKTTSMDNNGPDGVPAWV